MLSLQVGEPRIGEQEWNEQPPNEQPAPAFHAAVTWRLINTVLTHLHHQTLALERDVEDALNEGDDDEVPRVPAPRLAARDLPPPAHVDEAVELSVILSRVSALLLQHTRATQRVTTAWEQRAHGSPEPSLYDL